MTNLKILEKNLIDIGKVFDDNGINFFLSHGTLLGYFRDKRLILYDNDVDLGSFEDFNNKERREFIIEVLKKNGFEVVIRNEDNDTDRHMVVSSSEDGCKAIPYGIKFWRYNGDSMKETNFKTTYSFFKLKTVEFLGRQFKVPDRCEDLLKIWYGDGWNIKGKSLWILRQRDKTKYNESLVPYHNQKMGYRASGVIEAIVKCDKDGNIIYPLERIGRTVRGMQYD